MPNCTCKNAKIGTVNLVVRHIIKILTSDVNKNLTFKAKAKDLIFKAKDLTAFTGEYFIDTFHLIHFKKYA